MTSREGRNMGWVSGMVRALSTRDSSASRWAWVATPITSAPRALTSFTLLISLSNSWFQLASATTRVPSSMREMVPCFSSPAA